MDLQPTPNAAPAARPTRKVLTGPAYRDFVKLVTTLRRASSYLEVGVHNGSTLEKIDCASIAVDPEFVFDRNPVGKKPALHLFQMTSDDYFRDHDPRQIFGGPVDVAFLDGMHLFEFLLRDFINTERVCAPSSVILLDDCLPINIEMAERERRPALRQDRQTANWWTGDVWKVVSVLREYRPELKIVPVDVNPTGSIAVTGLDPGSTRLKDAYDEIMGRYLEMELTPERFEVHWADNAPLAIPAAISRLFPTVVVKRAPPVDPLAALNEGLLAALPLTPRRVLEIGAGAESLAARYARLNPAAEFTVATPDSLPASGSYDLVIARTLAADPTQAGDQAARISALVEAGGYIVGAVAGGAPGLQVAGLEILRAVNQPLADGSQATIFVARRASDEVCAQPPLNLHYRLMAPRSMDVRTRLPVEALTRDPELAVSMGLADFSASRLPVEAPKVVVHQRQGVTNEAEWLGSTALLIRRGWISVSEFDDHPRLTAAAYGQTPTEETWRHFSHYHAVQTSTARLGALFAALNPNVAVFQNAVFDLPPFSPHPGAPRIFYGAINRGPFAAEVFASLGAVAAEFPEAQFIVVGDQAVFDAIPGANKQFVDHLPYERYLAVMRQCHINLSPLEPVEGADCKSDAKFLDASQGGLVTVASPTAYADTIRQGETGFIADRLSDWTDIVLDLLRDPARRETVAHQAWRYVRDQRMFAHQAAARRDWYKSLWARREELNREIVERVPALRSLLAG